MDSFYTPSLIGKKMIGAVHSSFPSVIADFTAGSGELLKCAKQKWPDASLVGTDIDRHTITRLRRQEPGWYIGVCDFLKNNSRQRCGALKNLEGRVSLVLLNPPFSCRGGSQFDASIAGHSIRCSRAMAFLLNAIRYLAPEGEIIAILPAGSLSSQKDERAWALLRMMVGVEIVGTNGHRTFNGCFPRTVIVRLSTVKGTLPVRTQRNTASVSRPYTLVLHRGKVPMYTVPECAPENAVPLVHSTSLQESRVILGEFYAKAGEVVVVQGPLVLLPRVGQPKDTKLVFYKGTRKFAISDCIFALSCTRRGLARVYASMKKNWKSVERLYTGTGARYVPSSTIAGFLHSLGFGVQPANGCPRSFQLARAVERRSDVQFSPEQINAIERERERLGKRAERYDHNSEGS